MSKRMKILIGCDGSEYSEKILADVQRAGLPAQAEVIVLTVAEHWLAAPTNFAGIDIWYADDPGEAARTIEIGQNMKSRLNSHFPEWEIQTEAVWGTAGSKLIERADEWKPDLLVVGSHGRSALGRVFLGSVSQRVLHDAHCSVRIARGQIKESDAPAKILIGMDGSKSANAAVEAVANRKWPENSQVRFVNATWFIPSPSSTKLIAPIAHWVQGENERVRLAIEAATNRLSATGLSVSTLVEQEDPQKLICHEAEHWEADCIFLGARGMGTVDRFLIGSISAAVAAKAICPVEIVRFPK